MTATEARPTRVPPRVVIRVAWLLHRALLRFSGGRIGLRPPKAGMRFGMLRLTTVGRRSGQARVAIVGYLEDGPNLVVLAMNGWDEGHPSWWLNLEEHPDAVVRLAGQHPNPVRARRAAGEERDRLWQRWVAVDPQLDTYAGRRSTQTPVVVLESRDGTT